MARKKSRKQTRQNAKLKKALKVPAKKQQDYSLLLLILVAVVAVIVIVMSQPAATVGEAYNVPSNMCDGYCPEGQSGIPMGAHGRVHFCKCANIMGP